MVKGNIMKHFLYKIGKVEEVIGKYSQSKKVWKSIHKISEQRSFSLASNQIEIVLNPRKTALMENLLFFIFLPE